MDGFSILDQRSWRPELYADTPEYKAGNAFGWLYRGNKQAAMNYPLSGRLYCAKSGWLLLSVPNALVRGVFDALSAPGTELPLAGVMNVPNVDADVLNAHISVMNAAEVSSIGCDKINERGHMFSYRLGGMKEINVKNVDGVSKVWAIQVYSPELMALRKSYGLSPLMNGDHAFHITVAVRRKHVLQDNGVSKAAADDKLPGGVADGLPDSKFPPKALAEGVKHEHEHTSDDQTAKEIAKDHLSEDKSYYEKIKEIEQKTANVYMNQLRNMYSFQRPITYDYNKPVFENIRDQAMEIKRRGDFMINARRNHQQYMAAISPQYRYQLAMQAMRGELEQPSFAEQAIHTYGDHFLNMAMGRPK